MGFDYNEAIYEAIDIIVNKKLESISFDKTILCTVVDNSQKDKGIYIVTDGSIKFEAYSTLKYENNNNVYVQIPNGDWEQQKFIVGKKKTNDEIFATYSNPFQNYVDITGNLVNKIIDTGLVANNPEEQSKVLWSYSVQDGDIPLVNYTRLGLQGQFQSWLDAFDTVNGNYGLRLKINQIDEQNWRYIIELDSTDMNGNPYNFESYFQQEMVVDISSIDTINDMVLEFYQISGSFVDQQGELIKYKNEEELFGNELFLPNLYIKDPYVSLGYDVNEYDKGNFTIYSANGKTYGVDEANNSKKIEGRWVYKDNDSGKIKIITADDQLEYTVKWYRYKQGTPSADQYSGVYWQPLSTQVARFNVDKKYEIVYTIHDSDWLEYNQNFENEPLGLNFFTTWCLPNLENQQEKIKAIIIIKGQIFESNELVFDNKQDVIKQELHEFNPLIIECDDSTFGNYFIYNHGFSLVNSGESQKIRNFELYFRTKDDKIEKLTSAEQITWFIPNKNTMIVLDSIQDTDVSIDMESLKGYTIITRYGNIDNNYNIISEQPYRIKSYFAQDSTNNIIQCRITKDGITYTAIKELNFGVQGTTGTDVSLVLDFEESNRTALTLQENGVIVTAKLYDYSNKEVDITNKTVYWSFKNDTNYIEILSDRENLTNNQVKIKIKDGIINVPKDNYSILQAKIPSAETEGGWGDYDLISYMPIPIRINNEYLYITGTKTVVYDTTGQLIDYDQTSYNLYNSGNEKTDVQWGLSYSNTNEQFIPILKQNVLRPKEFYIKDSADFLCVYAFDNNNTILWSQPLLFMQNKYPIKMINDWNGSLEINEEQNYIFTATIAAGRKEEDNTFTGILIGDYGNKKEEAGEESISAQTGVYGFEKGQQNFAFKEDGTAFIGIDEETGDKVFTVSKDGCKLLNWKSSRAKFGTYQNDFFNDYIWGYDSSKKRVPILVKHTEGYLYSYSNNGNRKTLIRSDGVIHTKIENDITVKDSNGQDVTLNLGGEFYVGFDGQIYSSMGKFGGLSPMNCRWRIAEELQCWYKGYNTDTDSKGIFAIGPKGYVQSYWKDSAGNIYYAWRITSNGTAYFQNIRTTGGNLSSNIPWKNVSNYETIEKWKDSDLLEVDLDGASGGYDNIEEDFGEGADTGGSGSIITGTLEATDIKTSTDIEADELYIRRIIIGQDKNGNIKEPPTGSNESNVRELIVHGETTFNGNIKISETITDLNATIQELKDAIKQLQEQME